MEKKQLVCVYCGTPGSRKAGTLTYDHVIPRCLFDPKEQNPITVPACPSCNTLKKSRTDDYLRDMLVWDKDARFSSTAHRIRLKANRSKELGSSLAGKLYDKTSRMKPMFRRDGTYLGTHLMGDNDKKIVDQIFSTIVRGLYYARFDRRLPDDTLFTLDRINPDDRTKAWEFFQQQERSKHYTYYTYESEGNVFIYQLCVERNPVKTHWLLLFYLGPLFRVSTRPPSRLQDMTDNMRSFLPRIKAKAMKKYRCTRCSYVYDPEVGDTAREIVPGHPFESLAEEWTCPNCNNPKTMFEMYLKLK